MNCKRCKSKINENNKYLCCNECKSWLHLECLPHKITNNDYETITTSKLAWLCSECNSKLRKTRNDDTPIKAPYTVQCLDDSDGEGSDASNNTHFKAKILCGHCNKGFSYNSHRAICSTCDRQFHFKCQGISKEFYNEIQDKKPWTCTSCPSMTCSNPIPESQTNNEPTLRDLMEQLKLMRNENAQYKEDISKVLSSHSDLIFNNAARIDSLTEELAKSNKVVTDMKEENEILRKQIKNLESKILVTQQNDLKNQIEIHGIPVSENENIDNLVKKTFNSVGFDIKQEFISECTRYKARNGTNRPGGIVVKFVRKLDHDIFLARARTKRNLTTADLGFTIADPIFINQSLSYDYRKILNRARKLKEEKKYEFLWVDKDSKIFIRKKQGQPAIPITSIQQLDQL